MDGRKLPFCSSRGKDELPEGFFLNVPASLSSKQEIFDAYGVGLRAPESYFGNNWDGFFDCLMGLSWIEEHTVVIFHERALRIGSMDQHHYIECLSRAVNEWRSEEAKKKFEVFPHMRDHDLVVCFPERDISWIEQILV